MQHRLQFIALKPMLSFFESPKGVLQLMLTVDKNKITLMLEEHRTICGKAGMSFQKVDINVTFLE